MTRIAFLGNSHTFYNDMPGMLHDLAMAAGLGEIGVDSSTGNGVDLAWHWRSRQSRALIEHGDWDIVVLQERSGGPLEDPERMREHARLLHEAIVARGARSMLSMTWANRRRPEDQPAISRVYRELAAEIDAELAPVGEAWARVHETHPDLVLHDADDRHASPAGSYLAACVFLRCCCGRSPVGLAAPGGIRNAEILQRAAEATVDAEG